MGIKIPAATSLEAPEAANEVYWEKESTSDRTGFTYSGKNSFKSGEGEFTVVGQGNSFSATHAYLLLTDVPGASANSGATITAKDSGGKQAFIATETRGTTEQEVAVGAGNELKTLLDQSGKSEYIQSASLAKHVQNSGAATVSWSGGSAFSSEIEVAHGLGTTPTTIILTPEKVESFFVYATYNTVGASKFKLQVLANAVPKAQNTKVSWIAIS